MKFSKVCIVIAILVFGLILSGCAGADEKSAGDTSDKAANPDRSNAVQARPTLLEPNTGINKGEIALDFTLDGFQSQDELKNVRLYDFRGELVFLNFWGSWCPYCRVEMPQMERMYSDYRDRGFTILAIEGGQREGMGKIKEFVEENQLTFPILLDAGEINRLYKITSIPTTLLIGSDGVIIARFSGLPYNWDSLAGRSLIEKNLPKK